MQSPRLGDYIGRLELSYTHGINLRCKYFMTVNILAILYLNIYLKKNLFKGCLFQHQHT